MNKALRRAIIAGNWKMNMTPSEAEAAVKKTAELTKGMDECEVVLCVPFVDIQTAVASAAGTAVKIGAQNVHFAEKGAYTGEISAKMLLECGIEYVIIGHSERRQYFGETTRRSTRERSRRSRRDSKSSSASARCSNRDRRASRRRSFRCRQSSTSQASQPTR